MSDFKKHTTAPTTVGSSVVGIKYNKGVIIASDVRLTAYGYKKYNNISRIAQINDNTIIGSSGEYSDFQEIKRILEEKALEDNLYDGYNSFLGPKEFASYLAFISYQKRNKMNPYWNTTIVGGFDWEGNPYLNSVDQYGTRYENNYLVSGFALYFAGPLLEHAVPKDVSKLTKEKAIELIDDLFRVLFYRDANSSDRIYYGIIEKTGSENSDNLNSFNNNNSNNNSSNLLEGTGKYKFNLEEKTLQTKWEYDLFENHHNERYHPTA